VAIRRYTRGDRRRPLYCVDNMQKAGEEIPTTASRSCCRTRRNLPSGGACRLPPDAERHTMAPDLPAGGIPVTLDSTCPAALVRAPGNTTGWRAIPRSAPAPASCRYASTVRRDRAASAAAADGRLVGLIADVQAIEPAREHDLACDEQHGAESDVRPADASVFLATSSGSSDSALGRGRAPAAWREPERA